MLPGSNHPHGSRISNPRQILYPLTRIRAFLCTTGVSIRWRKSRAERPGTRCRRCRNAADRLSGSSVPCLHRTAPFYDCQVKALMSTQGGHLQGDRHPGPACPRERRVPQGILPGDQQGACSCLSLRTHVCFGADSIDGTLMIQSRTEQTMTSCTARQTLDQDQHNIGAWSSAPICMRSPTSGLYLQPGWGARRPVFVKKRVTQLCDVEDETASTLAGLSLCRHLQT